MCDPVSITLGVVSAGLGIAQAQAQYQAQRQQIEYQNRVAEQQFQYSKLQAQASRDSEAQKALAREEQMRQNEELARMVEANNIRQINLAYMEQQQATAQQKRGAALEAAEQRGAVLASGRVGNVIDSLLADVDRERAQFDFYSDTNLAFVGRQSAEQKRGAAATRASRVASVTPYIEQTVLDPIEPIKREAPSSTPYVLAGVSSAIGGVSTGLGVAGGIRDAGFKWEGGKYTRI